MAPKDQQSWGGGGGDRGGAHGAGLNEVRRLVPVQPRTMVEQAAEAIVAAAA